MPPCPQSAIDEIKTITGGTIHRRIIQVPQEIMLKAGEQCPWPTSPEEKTNKPGYVLFRRRCQRGKATSRRPVGHYDHD